MTCNGGFILRDEIIGLKKSVNSYLVTKDYILNHSDADMCYRFIQNYLDEIPIPELIYIISIERLLLRIDEFDEMLKLLFRH